MSVQYYGILPGNNVKSRIEATKIRAYQYEAFYVKTHYTTAVLPSTADILPSAPLHPHGGISYL